MQRSSPTLREADDSYLEEVTTRFVMDEELRALVDETREPKRQANESQRPPGKPNAPVMLDSKRPLANVGRASVSSQRDQSAAFVRSAVGIGKAPAAFVPVEVMQALLACATGYLGPAARPILGGELRRLRSTAQTLPWHLVPTLINSLATHLDTTRSAVEFSRSVQLAHKSLHAYWDIPAKR